MFTVTTGETTTWATRLMGLRTEYAAIDDDDDATDCWSFFSQGGISSQARGTHFTRGEVID